MIIDVYSYTHYFDLNIDYHYTILRKIVKKNKKKKNLIIISQGCIFLYTEKEFINRTNNFQVTI